MNDLVLEMRGISKTFGSTKANYNVNLKLYAGEIHALLGENGAGKSTLMNILTGIYKPDEGEIFFKGKEVILKTPKHAVDLGIGMVHQHFALIPTLSVAENIYLYAKNCKKILKQKEMETEIDKCSKEFNLRLDAKAKVWQLSVGEQQRVEIVKLLYRGAEIFILDEPSAVLTPGESVEMFKTLRKMADNGKVVVFISHKMNEVMANADRITVLKGGTVEDTMPAAEATQERLAGAVMGEARPAEQTRNSGGGHGDCVLRVEDLFVHNDKGILAVKNVNLELYSGEILGIAGVAGNGQRELSESLAGLRRSVSGAINIQGEDITTSTPKERIKKGIAFVPEDRLGMGLVPSMNMMENAILKQFDTEKFSKKGILNKKSIYKSTEVYIKEHDIKNGGMELPVSLMSGGNQQKLLIAREISGEPSLIIAAYPVRGLDIGATEAIHKILRKQKERGACIILISEELDEIFEMADRIGVMNSGYMSPIIKTAETSYEEIGSLMIGVDEGTEGREVEIA